MDGIFITILCGVSVFCFSQILLYFFFKPRREYLQAAGALSCEMLQLTNKYMNLQLNEDEIKRIQNAKANYIVAIWAYPTIYCKKRKRKGIELARQINIILNLNKNKKENYDLLATAVTKIEKLDKNVIVNMDRAL